jgi:ABC-type sugar transport system substrate-binding protein
MDRPDWTVVRRPGSPILFFIVVIFMLGIGYVGDHNSCTRSNGDRQALTAYFDGARTRALSRASTEQGRQQELDLLAAAADLDAIRHVRSLDCSFPFPAVSSH